MPHGLLPFAPQYGEREEAIDLVRESFAFISAFEGEIPGAKRKECGNYLEHDLPGARKTAADMLTVLRDWTEERLAYSE